MHFALDFQQLQFYFSFRNLSHYFHSIIYLHREWEKLVTRKKYSKDLIRCNSYCDLYTNVLLDATDHTKIKPTRNGVTWLLRIGYLH